MSIIFYITFHFLGKLIILIFRKFAKKGCEVATLICYIIINLKKQLLLKNSLFNSIFLRKKVCHKKLKILGNDRLGEIILILALTFSEKATIEKYIL